MTFSSISKRHFPGVVGRAIGAVIAFILLLVLAWTVWVLIGLRAAAQTAGALRVAGLQQPVRILRDDRDIPHIIASNDHDLMFAQGFAEASDRLFQMDLLRRYVYGQLAEVLGPGAFPADEKARIVNMHAIVQGQWERMDTSERMLLTAFAQGVNAAMRTQPLPVEFHILLYKPQAWQPQDSLAVGMATTLDLIDSWDDVIRRDEVARHHRVTLYDVYSVTDPAYDAPIANAAVAPVAPLPNRTGNAKAAFAPPLGPDRGPLGSNSWAIGAQRSSTGHALLANDPHLRLDIPGVWYLVDLHGGNFHVAGASLAGTPGVILGHNENIAWGATNGTVVTETVYRDPLANARKRVERFRVRFGNDRTITYYHTRHGFVVRTDHGVGYAVDWNAVSDPLTPLRTFEGLNQAHSIAQALQALRAYPGPPQNFIVADRSGAVAYHLAGLIPNDPSWGSRVHASSDPTYGYIPFNALPHVSPSRSATVFTANNRTYGAGYPYRLTTNFEPPYRAYRIRQLLSRKPTLDVADFARFQTDTLSLPERDIVRDTLSALRRKRLYEDPMLHPYVRALEQWNGRFDPTSYGAPVALELRRAAVADLARYNLPKTASAYEKSANNADLMLLMRVLRERPRGWWPHSDYDALLVAALRQAVHTHGTSLLQTWGEYAKITVAHPLSMLGMSFLDGATFPGDGDSFGIHVQGVERSQSFRAVWDVGNWDAGGLEIPSGESGEPASGHYTDLSPTWIAQRLVPLPFSDSAIRAATRATLVLTP